jgi:tryptophan halogenase
VKNFVVVGGGTAGFLTALYTRKMFPNDEVTVIHSKDIGVLGAGEGSSPNLVELFDYLEIPIDYLIKKTKATIRNGTKFSNWSNEGDTFYTDFAKTIDQINPYHMNSTINFREFMGPSIYDIVTICNDSDTNSLKKLIDEKNKVYFMHNSKIDLNLVPFYEFQRFSKFGINFDAKLMASVLEQISNDRNINVIDGKVKDFMLNDLNDVTKVIMENEETIDVDFIFDCSGFARLLIGKLYKTDWISYSDRLPVDRAIAFFLEIDKNNIPTYTNATALEYGWMWQVPLQHRYGCGYAYDSSYLSEEDAKKEVEEKIGQEINIVKSFNFNPGVYKEIWKNNCLSIGLASGFLEPIDATSLSQVVTLLENFFLLKHKIFDNNDVSKKEINDYYVNQSSSMSDYVQMHYLTNKTNSEFWLNFEENHPILDSLKDKINKMDNTVLRNDAIRETFSEHDYYTVWHGMHRLNIDNIKSIYNENKLFLFSEWWNDQKNQELKTVEDLVDHVQFLEYFGGLDS